MNSRIYEGTLSHCRLAPTQHAFAHPVTYYGFDLDELEQLDREVTGFGLNRFRPITLRDQDYLTPGPEPLLDKIHHAVARFGIEEMPARVQLITVPRHLGYVFNPVSFYLGYDEEHHLSTLVAEVNNTFGDRHLYVMPVTGDQARHQKEFHVSPFNDMQGEYVFRVRDEGPEMEIAIELRKCGEPVFHATLSGRGRPFNGRHLVGVLLRHPLRPWLTMPRIIVQAALLHFRRRLPVFRRPEPTNQRTVIRRPPDRMQRWAMKAVLEVLSSMKVGMLRITLPDGSEVCCGDDMLGPTERLRVNDYRFFTRLALGGDVGLGEAIVEGDAACEDVTRLLELLIANRDELADGKTVVSWMGKARDRIGHLLRPNSRRTSRKNIEDHYDLSNDFFQTFLDPTMTYSAALFRGEDESLEQAQYNKLRALIEQARIEPGQHVLEIGSGWGSFAIEAARSTGCRVTSVTLSREQRDFARRRVREAGLQDRVDIRLCDYREIEDQFDRIVSIEMLEAVGHRYYDRFFKQCERLLKPDGVVALQVITIPDARYRSYLRGCDWIQKHIFPGGHLPSLTALSASMTRSSRFYVERLTNIGTDYARTLKLWRQAFEHNAEEVERLGFDARFRRKWGYYLSYCEAAFATRTLNTLHLVMTRAGNRQLLRDDERGRARPHPARQRSALGGSSR